MPFLPTHATLDHCDEFAVRLHRRLRSCSRPSAMSVVQAFAQASGYANAHALEVAIKGRKSHDPLTDGLPGVEPAAIKRWATQAWKAHKEALNLAMRGVIGSQQLLAVAWGYASWEDFALAVSAHQNAPWPWVTEAREDWALESYGGWQPHSFLGLQSDFRWVGLPREAATSHALLIDNDQDRRYETAARLVAHRIGCGESVTVFDCSHGHRVAALLRQEGVVVQDVGAELIRDVLPSMVQWPSQHAWELVSIDGKSVSELFVKNFLPGDGKSVVVRLPDVSTLQANRPAAAFVARLIAIHHENGVERSGKAGLSMFVDVPLEALASSPGMLSTQDHATPRALFLVGGESLLCSEALPTQGCLLGVGTKVVYGPIENPSLLKKHLGVPADKVRPTLARAWFGTHECEFLTN